MKAAGNSIRDLQGLAIRLMRATDIDFGLELCRIVGWNQLRPDWERLLALEPEGVFVAEMDGRPCATGSTTAYGTRTAWIGMILVHPDFRRRGIGSAIMNRCIEYLRGCGVESIKLDATDQGRPVYLKLGFQDERPIWRLAGDRPQGLETDPDVREIREGDWPSIGALDRTAFDADRVALLEGLSSEGISAVVESAVRVGAVGFARKGQNAAYVGPIVSRDAETARRVVASLLARLPEGNVFWDILPDNEAACELAESFGFSPARRLTRMYLGSRMHPGEVNLIYAAAGFEVG